MQDKILAFDVTRFSIEESKDERLMKIRISGIAEGMNRKKTIFTLESMQDAVPTVRKTAILAYFDKFRGDVTDHRCRLIGEDPETKTPVYDFTNGEKIIGFVGDDADVKIETVDGVNWLTYTGYIFTNYNYEIKQLLRRYPHKKVSVEVRITEWEELPNDVIKILKFKMLGTTLLGEMVREGIAGAHLDLMSYSQENMGKFVTQLSYALHSDQNAPNIKVTRKYSIKEGNTLNKQFAELGMVFLGKNDTYAFGMKEGKVLALKFEKNPENSEIILMSEKPIETKLSAVFADGEYQVEYDCGMDMQTAYDSKPAPEDKEKEKEREEAYAKKELELKASFEAEKKTLTDGFAAEKKALQDGFTAEKKTLTDGFAAEKKTLTDGFTAEKKALTEGFATEKTAVEKTFADFKKETFQKQAKALVDTYAEQLHEDKLKGFRDNIDSYFSSGDIDKSIEALNKDIVFAVYNTNGGKAEPVKYLAKQMFSQSQEKPKTIWDEIEKM